MINDAQLLWFARKLTEAKDLPKLLRFQQEPSAKNQLDSDS